MESRNIWGGQIAVDGERIYYTDYDNGAGAHLVFFQPRDGGQALVIAARNQSDRFGFGMATDGASLYWTSEADSVGYTLLATPVLGGRSQELFVLGACTARGVAVDTVAAYAGVTRCEGQPAHVYAAPHGSGTAHEIWSSPDADVSDVAARDGEVWIATSAGLVHVSATATELVDGHPIYHVEIAGDDVLYSTDESIVAVPRTGGPPHTRYTFHTPISQPRAFASDAGDLYISEPPELVFVPLGGEPTVIAADMGAAITHIVARDGAAYWPTLAAPGSVGLLGSFSGAVLRVTRPCL